MMITIIPHGLPVETASKLEIFAAMAMQGLLANPEWTGSSKATTEAAIDFADALLTELGKL